MSTPIFDQLAGELGDPELPVWDRVKRVQGYTLDDLYALQAAVRRYQTSHQLPVRADRPYYVNHENHSLQEVTIQPPSDMVERCLPSKETCMTLNEIPGGQEHGVVIPPEPVRTHRVRFLQLMERTPGWVQKYNYQDPNSFAFQHNDGRGFQIRFTGEGDLEIANYFDLGQITHVIPDGDDFTTLTTAICARAYWPEHVRRCEQDEAERQAANEETRRLDDLANAEADRQLHESSDGKFLNPGATIAKHRAVADTEEERAKAPVYGVDVAGAGGAIFAQFPDGSVRMVQDRHTSGGPAVGADEEKKFPMRFELPPEVVEKVAARVDQIKKMAEELTGVRTEPAEELQPTSILPQGHEFEILREAADTIGGGRQDDYGNAEDSFAAIAKMWQAYLAARGARGPLDGRDVACMMSLLKVARDAKGRKRDNLVDIAGYAALGERATRSDR